MTLLFNIILALALAGAVTMFFLMRGETSAAKVKLAQTSVGTQAHVAEKLEVNFRAVWQVFAVVFAVAIIASFTLIN